MLFHTQRSANLDEEFQHSLQSSSSASALASCVRSLWRVAGDMKVSHSERRTGCTCCVAQSNDDNSQRDDDDNARVAFVVLVVVVGGGGDLNSHFIDGILSTQG